jgi:hypothetical protein
VENVGKEPDVKIIRVLQKEFKVFEDFITDFVFKLLEWRRR